MAVAVMCSSNRHDARHTEAMDHAAASAHGAG